MDNYGYDVYRGEDESGPFERITAQPIPGAGTSDTPSKYEFVDDQVDPTKAYYYYIESISMQGVRQEATPVMRKAPKQSDPATNPSPSPTPK
ncbi:MAG: hypothetical protein U0166_15990 [Acidobacteriota bacterium]